MISLSIHWYHVALFGFTFPKPLVFLGREKWNPQSCVSGQNVAPHLQTEWRQSKKMCGPVERADAGFAPCYRQTIRLPLQEWGEASQPRSQSNLAGMERDICIHLGKPGEQVTGSTIQGRHRTDSPETHKVWLSIGALRAWGGQGWGPLPPSRAPGVLQRGLSLQHLS